MATSRQYKEPFLGQNISPSEIGAYFCVVTGIVGRCGPCAIEAASRRGTARRTCPTTPVAVRRKRQPFQRERGLKRSSVPAPHVPACFARVGRELPATHQCARKEPRVPLHEHACRSTFSSPTPAACIVRARACALRCAAMSNTPALAYGGDETVRGHPARRAPPALLAAPQRARPFGAICLQLRHPARPPITSRCAPPANRLSRGIVASR